MTENDKYILDGIRKRVWSGFADAEEVNVLIDDLLEEDDDEDMLRAAVGSEFAKKAREERSWPKVTDCDRLETVFKSLNSNGFIALHNAGYEMSDGHAEVAEEFAKRGEPELDGYCFYHGQDVEGALSGRELYIAFRDMENTGAGKLKAGKAVKAALTKVGFKVVWKDDPQQRILIPDFDWKRRSTKKGNLPLGGNKPGWEIFEP